MSYCQNCGSNIQPGANVCTECGAKVESPHIQNVQPNPQPTHYQSNTSVNQPYQASNSQYGGSPNDPGGFGYGLLGFCIPIVGLILFLVWQDDKPNNAKAAGTGALISVGLTIFFYVVLIGAAI